MAGSSHTGSTAPGKVIPGAYPRKGAGFSPKSNEIIQCGTSRTVSNLILAGIFNSLIVVLSHMIYAVHSVAGLFILSYFHQAFENLFLATVYILMVLKVPGHPLTINGCVWGFMGLAMGFWPVLMVAVPAGLAADRFIRARGRHRTGSVLLGYTFYATLLGVANGWPVLLLKDSNLVRRTAEMDPLFAGLVNTATIPLFLTQAGTSLIAAWAGGLIALKLINKHFKPAGLL